MVTITITRASGLNGLTRLRKRSSSHSFTRPMIFCNITHLPFRYPDVPVFHDLEFLHSETVRVIITSDRVNQVTAGDKASFGHVRLPENHLPGVCYRRIGVHIEIAGDTVHLYNLVDITRNDTVVVPFFSHILIVFESTFIYKEQRPVYITFDGFFVG